MSKTRLTVKGDGLERLKGVFRELSKQPHVNVGVLGGQHGELSNAELMAMMEFGSPQGHVPPRPVFRETFTAKQAEWERTMKSLLADIAAGNLSTEAALAQLGAEAAADLRQRLLGGDGLTPDAPRTDERKGSSTPLVDTRQLEESFDFEVIT